MAWLLYDIENPKYRGLVLRRNADDLKDWIDRARRFYVPTGAEFVGNPAEIRFPWGAIIRTGHLKDSNAYSKYQGHEYQRMLIEELTQIAREKDYEALLGSLRSTVEGLKPQIFCTTNPDGIGYEWVKQRWGIPDGIPKETIITTDKKTGRTRAFVPSRLEDNKYLLKDQNYINYLDSIQDETLKKQWREGDWSEPQIEGAYYAKQLEEARDEGRILEIPREASFPVDTIWDLGMSDSTAIWFVQQIGMQYRFIDYYENSGEGLEFYAQVLQEKGYVYRNHYAPHDIEVRELGTGLSRKETAKRLGIDFQLVPNLQVIEGINIARNFLPKCIFDEVKCKEGLYALKNYRKEFDAKRNEYKPHPLHDWSSHAADAFRYAAIALSKYTNQQLSNRQQYIPPTGGFMRR